MSMLGLQALYKVVIGRHDKNGPCDNWSSKTVLALNATAAIKKVKLHASEYIADVRIVDRES